MFAINSISPNFQAKAPASCNKFAEQKAERFFEITKEVTQKATEKVNTQNLKEAVLSKFSHTENSVSCVIKQAPKVYETTSRKLAEQKGARLFQEI